MGPLGKTAGEFTKRKKAIIEQVFAVSIFCGKGKELDDVVRP